MSNRKIIFSLAFCIFALSVFFANFASANLIVDPAKLGILRLELYPMSPAVAVREFKIGNTYNTSMQVMLEPVEGMKNLISLSEANFTLQPNENKTIEYTVTINEPGYYTGGIMINAKAGNSSSVGYNAQLSVFVNKSNLEPYFYVAIAAVVIAVAIIFVLYFRKITRRKK